MRKAVKLYALLGVLAVVCLAAFAVSRHEEKKEQIKNSGEVILSIPADSVTALSWDNESGTFSFTKGESWSYDGDSEFPVDEEKIIALIEQFEAFSAAFVIENAEDLSQYGLNEPVCTIRLTVGEECYTLELGDFSRMDEQRYFSIGDGNAYLAVHDPLDEFDAVLSDLILDDTVPDFGTVETLAFSGGENYAIVRDEEGKSVCEQDVYFTDGKPLDTDNVDAYLDTIQTLALTSYVSYNVSDEELSAFGLDDPELTVTLEYSGSDSNSGEEGTQSFVLHLARDREELAAYEQALADEESSLPAVTCYARVGESRIVYQISSSVYKSLTAASYDELRHQALFTAAFGDVTEIEVTLDGETSRLAREVPDGEENAVWMLDGTQVGLDGIETALKAVQAKNFTDADPTQKEELRLSISLDSGDFPDMTLSFYRYDGESCIAQLDGETVAFVSRSQVVDLIEAIHAVTLNS